LAIRQNILSTVVRATLKYNDPRLKISHSGCALVRHFQPLVHHISTHSQKKALILWIRMFKLTAEVCFCWVNSISINFTMSVLCRLIFWYLAFFVTLTSLKDFQSTHQCIMDMDMDLIQNIISYDKFQFLRCDIT